MSTTSIEELRKELVRSCDQHKILRALMKSEVEKVISILLEMQFADDRKAAQRDIRQVLDEAIGRLHEESKNAD